MKVSRENALPVGYDAGLGTIEKWILEGKEITPKEKKGVVYPLEIRDEYLAFQRQYLGSLEGLNIAVDLSNGASGLFVKELFGDNVQYICDEMDGNFPCHEPNPLVAENRQMLKEYLLENKCDIGVIYDGDADRVMFLDEKGEFVSPDLLIALMGQFFVKGVGTSAAAAKRRELIACGNCTNVQALQDIRSSKAISEYLAPMGVTVNTWKVGRAFAAPRLRELKGLFGGELAGHYYFEDFYYSDSGIMASLIILDIVAQLHREGRKFSKLVAEIESYCNSGEINFKIERKLEAMDAVRDYFLSKEEAVAQYDFDGYRVEFPDWWFNIRPSNTEPYLRFLCEASSQQLLEEKVSKVREIVKSLE